MKKYVIIGLSLFMILVSGNVLVQGLPRFTAVAEQKCNLCHVNPTGGGMRNAYGSQYYARTEMADKVVPFEDIEKFQPNVSDNISLGGDLRTLYYHDDENKRSGFFQMEGLLHVHAQLDKNLSLTFSKDLQFGYEIFATGYYLPKSGYLKIGKFQPAYGWRFADHLLFVRDKMTWGSFYTDTGIEFGLLPRSFSVNLGFYNGTGNSFDNNQDKAVSGRALYRKSFGKFGVGLGASIFNNNSDAGSDNTYGSFYYLQTDRLNLLGEIDWREDFSSTRSLASSQVVSYLVKRGLWLEAKYDFFDPDTDFQTGSTTRYGLALQYFPIGFVEIYPNIRYYSIDNPAGEDDNYIYFDGQIHVFF